MTDMRGMEMKIHKVVERLGKLEARIDEALKVIEEMNKTKETIPVDRNYKGFKNNG